VGIDGEGVHEGGVHADDLAFGVEDGATAATPPALRFTKFPTVLTAYRF